MPTIHFCRLWERKGLKHDLKVKCSTDNSTFNTKCMPSLAVCFVCYSSYSGTGKPVNSETIKHLCSLLEKLPSVMTLRLVFENKSHLYKCNLISMYCKLLDLKTL